MPARQRQQEIRTEVATAAASWGEVRESDPDEAARRRVALEKAIRVAYEGGIDVDDIVTLTGSRHPTAALTDEEVVAILL